MEPATPLTDLPLPNGILRLLTDRGVRTAGDLAALTDRDLAAISGIGPTGIIRVRRLFPAPAGQNEARAWGAPTAAAAARAG